jgi:Zinc carboxypeptidase/Chitobiase/beta-hexosaminidase C-terminal domain
MRRRRGEQMRISGRSLGTSVGIIAGLLVLVAGNPIATATPPDTVHVARADYFQSSAGSFLEVWATSDAAHGDGSGGSSCVAPCPSLTVQISTDGTTFHNAVAQTTLSPFVDDGVYLRHRVLIRLSNFAGNATVVRPVSVQVTSSMGGVDTATVDDYLDTPASAPAGFQKDFFSQYQTPEDATAVLNSYAAQRPDIAHVIQLPNKTHGYRRNAQAAIGCNVAAGSPGNGQLPGTPGATPAGFATPSACSATEQPRAVVLTSRQFGNDGGIDRGNVITARFTNPGVPNSPLSVSVVGSDISVGLATDATGALVSTAAQVVAAVNASPDASALVTAQTFENNAGTGIVQSFVNPVHLSDFLFAPTTGQYAVARSPYQLQALRICKVCDGSKPGVLLYAGEQAADWVEPIVALEAAGRLLSNYGTDPATTALVNNLDIFVVPVVNPDGFNYGMLTGGGSSQTKNMTQYCGPTSGHDDPGNRNSWGVDLDANFSVGSIFDGYAGAGTSCFADTYAGPSEVSEPESQNINYLASTFPNIRFAVDSDSTGGEIAWPPGAYKANGRQQLPPPSFGTNAWFAQTARAMNTSIAGSRGTVIPPDNVGPRTDTVGSDAGNSIDDLYYNHNILGLLFACGADQYSSTSVTSNTGVPVGPQPAFTTEGHAEAVECAGGLYGFLNAVLAYAGDTSPPDVDAVPGTSVSADPISVHFIASEPADVYYTTDGSTPTTASSRYSAAGPFELDGQTLTFTNTTQLKWIAVDVKGNTSAVKSATYTINPVVDTTPPVVTDHVTGTLGTNGWYIGDVTVQWDTSDPDSSLTSPPCASSTVTSDTTGVTFSCTAVSAGGTTTNSVTITRDATPPVVSFDAHPASYTANQTISIGCTSSDATSGIATPCAPINAPASSFPLGLNTVSTSATDAAGNPTTVTTTFTVNPTPDATPPSVTPTVTGILGTNGWYTSDVTVAWTVADPESPIVSAPCSTSTVTADTTGATFSCTATSTGGTTTNSVTIQRDATAPTVAFAAHPTSYTVDKTVSIGCTSSDATSGIATPCAPINAAAYTFAVGPNTVATSAIDAAGNNGTATTSFTVQVTTASLCTLTTQFVQTSANYQALRPAQRAAVDALATATCAIIKAIDPKLSARQHAQLVASYKTAVDGLVRAHWLTANQATILDALANSV